MTKNKKKQWKRSKSTTRLIHTIRRTLNAAGYTEELAATPLLTSISVIAKKGEDNYNVRLDKETLEIISEEKLVYDLKKGNVRRVFRES